MSNFIGIFGGAFDPPHFAHLMTAKQLMVERKYDKLVLLPSHNPPHKKLNASDEDRLKMLSLLIDDNMEVSDLEIKRNGVGYTADYLPELIEKYGDNIEYIIGGDSFLNFSKWSRPFEIIKLVKLLVVARDGEREKLQAKLTEYDNIDKKGITIAEYLPPSMSSSEIRNRLRLQMSVDDMLDIKVQDYITQNKLYNEYDTFITKLKNSISAERLNHTKNVVLVALNYCDKLKLDYNDVFLACLLHDCAKDIANFERYAQDSIVPKDSLNTPVAHAFCGKVVAKSEYGINNNEILDAIYYHTTARPNMTSLEKLVYVADMLEQTRDFDGVDNLRKITNRDFEEGFVQCLNATVKHLIDNNKEIYPLTLEAYEYYKRS